MESQSEVCAIRRVPPWCDDALTTDVRPALKLLVDVLVPEDDELPQAETTVAMATAPAAAVMSLVFRMMRRNPSVCELLARYGTGSGWWWCRPRRRGTILNATPWGRRRPAARRRAG